MKWEKLNSEKLGHGEKSLGEFCALCLPCPIAHAWEKSKGKDTANGNVGISRPELGHSILFYYLLFMLCLSITF